MSGDSALLTSQKNSVPYQPSRQCVIPSGRSSIHCSSTRTTCHTVRTSDRPSIIRPDDMDFRSDPSLYREASVLAFICPDVSAARPDASQSIKLQILSKVQIWEDHLNPPDDVVYLPDARLFKASSQFKLNRSNDSLPWSGRALIRYGNCVLKINRPDGHPPWSGRAKPYMEITCSRRATVRTTVPHRPDAALKQERFSEKISEILVVQLSVRTSHVHRPDGTRIFYSSRPFEPQPINRSPWALRTARIWY
jgi:hypothetical protein